MFSLNTNYKRILFQNFKFRSILKQSIYIEYFQADEITYSLYSLKSLDILLLLLLGLLNLLKTFSSVVSISLAAGREGEELYSGVSLPRPPTRRTKQPDGTKVPLREI